MSGQKKLNEVSLRFHGLDALRAVAMLLGIVLHASIAYMDEPVPNWPHDSDHSSIAFSFLYEFIHSFRMPLFFLIAGFFSNLVISRKGRGEFIRQRRQRIVIPFLVSLCTVLPLTLFPFHVVHFERMAPGDWSSIFRLSLRESLSWNGLAHLWFLYYLIIYYVALLVLVRWEDFEQWIHRVHPGFILTAIIGLLCLAVAFLPGVFIPVATGLFPPPGVLGFYWLFFLGGYYIYIRIDALEFFATFAEWFLISGLVLFCGLFYFWHGSLLTTGRTLVAKLILILETCLLVIGFMGVFIKYFRKERHFWRYVSDASYWMYLVHMCMVASLQLAFIHTTLAGWARFPLILLVTFFISLVTYDLFIRYSVIGRYLHGSRIRKS